MQLCTYCKIINYYFLYNNSITIKVGFRKIVPILRLKSLIISKALYNPGFPTLVQNLMFNECPIPLNLNEYGSLMQHYYLGCENKIVVTQIPNFIEK